MEGFEEFIKINEDNDFKEVELCSSHKHMFLVEIKDFGSITTISTNYRYHILSINKLPNKYSVRITFEPI